MGQNPCKENINNEKGSISSGLWKLAISILCIFSNYSFLWIYAQG